MEVINATFASNKIMQNMCTTINSQALGIDYMAGQQTVPNFYNFCYLIALSECECHGSWGSACFQLWNTNFNIMIKEVQHIKQVVNFISMH